MNKRISFFLILAAVSFVFVGCFEDGNGPTSPDDDGGVEAEITSPACGRAFLVGEMITLIGTGVDLEDGVLSDSSLVWTKNHWQDTLGTGDTVRIDTLSAGEHLIRLTATDSEGNSGSDLVVISVEKTHPAQLTLENIWPNNDGTMWKYSYTQRFWDFDPSSIIYYPDEESVPEIPSLSQIEQMLRNQPVGEIESVNLGIYEIQFAGDTTTLSGATGQNLREIIIPEQAGGVQHAGMSARNAFLMRLCLARPDLAEKIHQRYPELPIDVNILRIDAQTERMLLSTLAEVIFNPYLIHGGAWEKTEDYIGTYGDVDQSLAWKFLESNLNVSHQFSFQLVPSLASDVFLHCKILRNFRAQTYLGSYENAIECLYVIDYGIWEATDQYGESLGFSRCFDYGSVVYAPGAGPLYCYERSMLFPGDQPTLGIGDKELILEETNVYILN